MVSLNLTFFIELGLFLVFLWVINRIVFRPALEVMDRRESRIAENRSRAREEHAEARELSERYANEVFAARRSATQRVEEARREALDERSAAIQEQRRKIDQRIQDVRNSAKRQIDAERSQIEACADELVQTLAQQLTPRGGRP